MEYKTGRLFSIWVLTVSLSAWIIFLEGCFFQVFSQNGTEIEIVKFIESNELIYPGGPPLTGAQAFVTVKPGRGILYMTDHGGPKPFVRVDIATEEFHWFGGWGRGPGEVNRNGFQALSFIDDKLYIYDFYENKLETFDVSGEFSNSWVLTNTRLPGLFLPYNQNRALYRTTIPIPGSHQDAWLSIYELNNDEWRPVEKELLNIVNHPDLEPIRKNPAMGIGPIAVDRTEGAIFIASLYSTLLAGIQTNGEILFKTYLPGNHYLPDVDIRFAEGGIVTEPENPIFHAIDIAVCQHYIYVLYSGDQYQSGDLTNLFDQGGGVPENVRPGEADKVHLFDKRTGAFLKQLDIPFLASSIEADEEYLYFISWDEPVSIVVAKKPSL